MDNSITIPAQTIPLPPAATQRGLDAVIDLGFDNTGNQDCSVRLQDFFDSNSYPPELHFAPGRYRFNTYVETNKNLIKLIGDGQISNIGPNGPVIFFSDQPMKQLLWFNSQKKGCNLQGPWIEHIQFQDTSLSHNNVASMIRFTSMANIYLNDVGGMSVIPRRYANGSVSVTKDSQTVTGRDSWWNDSMLPGFLCVDGYPYEIQSVNSATSLTLAIKYLGKSANNRPYAISSGGIFLWFDPGQDYTQYAQCLIKSHDVGIAAYFSAGTGATGTSRIKVRGYVNGGCIADSIGAYMGPFCDTVRWEVAENNFAFGVIIADGHQNDISGADFENAASAPPVTGGSSNNYDANKGVLVMSDDSSDTWGNRITNNYFRQAGTAIEFLGTTSPATQSKVAFNTFRSNYRNFVNGGATKTAGEADGIFYGSAFSPMPTTSGNRCIDKIKEALDFIAHVLRD